MALIKLNQIKNGTQLKSDVENLKNTLSAETLADNEAFSSKYVLKENTYTKDEIDAKILTAQGGEIDKEAVNKQLEQIITDDTDNHIVSPTELQEALSEYTKTADLKTAQGESAYDVAKKNGFKGTEAEWLKSLNGKAATITVGNVTSGETASVINSGTDSAAVFDFVLPQPHDGKSAYEVAKNNGFEGTEAEWLQSLKGEKGDQGEDAAPYDDTAIKKQIQDLSGKVDAIKVPDTSNLATKDELKGVSDKVDTLPTTDNIVTKDQLDSYVPMSTYEDLLKRVSALESNGSNPSSGSEPTPPEGPTDKPSEPVDDDPTAESKVLWTHDFTLPATNNAITCQAMGLTDSEISGLTEADEVGANEDGKNRKIHAYFLGAVVDNAGTKKMCETPIELPWTDDPSADNETVKNAVRNAGFDYTMHAPRTGFMLYENTFQIGQAARDMFFRVTKVSKSFSDPE